LVAENLSHYLKVNLVDYTSGKEVIRDWRYLNESVSARIKRTAEKLPPIEVPTTMTINVSEFGISKLITIPPSPFAKSLTLIIFLIFMTMWIFWGLMIFSNIQEEVPFIKLVFFGFSSICFVVAIFYPLWFLQRKIKIEILLDRLLVIEKLSIFSKKTEFPFAKLEEIIINRPNKEVSGFPFYFGSIFLRSDEYEIAFGRTLTEPELSYLYALLINSFAEKS